MKKSKKIVLSLLFSILTVATVTAQMVRVQDAPDWFFNQPAGEYVGVSLPLENQELAQLHAVYVALISHAVRRDLPMRGVRGVVATRETREAEASTGGDLVVSNTRLFLPNYEIVRTAINQYGEVFVSVRITGPSTDATLEWSTTLMCDGITRLERLTYAITADRSNYEMTIRFVTRSENGEITELVTEILRIAQRSPTSTTQDVERFFLDQGRAFSYRQRLQAVLSGNRDLLSRPLRYSLSVAYTNLLLFDIASEVQGLSANPWANFRLHIDGENLVLWAP